MKINGVSISKGLGIGSALFIKKDFSKLDSSLIAQASIESESEKFFKARREAIESLKLLSNKAAEQFGPDKEGIFEGQILILEDEELESDVISLIKKDKYNAAYAVFQVFNEIISMIENHKDAYLRERNADYKDARNRIISCILGHVLDLSLVKKDVVLITDELTPSDTMQVDLAYVKGFITTIGGETSHAAILARTMSVPALVIDENKLRDIRENEQLIIDADLSCLFLSPDEKQIKEYEKKIKENEVKKLNLIKLKDKDAKTKDGTLFTLKANIGSLNDIKYVNEFGALGVGLFRSEFLYMETSQPPSEDEQFEVYKKVLEDVEKGSITIRTLDIGGDKPLSYLNFPKEENPFLGWRAIRMYKDESELMQTQFNALLRASHYGSLKVMVPMINSVEEVKIIRDFIERAKESLRERNLPFDEALEIGSMIETPAAALISNELADYVDFFSIGTNDLTQYTLAVDRGNKKIAYLYDPYHPAVLKLIKETVEAAKRRGRELSVCGELGGDKIGVLLLAGLGVRILSMVPSAILNVKELLSRYTIKELEELADYAMKALSLNDLKKYLNKFLGV